MMQIFAEKNAPLEALNWALPQLLAAISAEAGALFMPGRRAGMLVCSACIGPVDIAGAEVPVASSLVGKVFSDGKRRLSHNLQAGATYDRRIDRQTGLQTRPALTVPVALGPDRFGALQAINKKPAEKKPAGKNISGKKQPGKTYPGKSYLGRARTGQTAPGRVSARQMQTGWRRWPGCWGWRFFQLARDARRPCFLSGRYFWQGDGGGLADGPFAGAV